MTKDVIDAERRTKMEKLVLDLENVDDVTNLRVVLAALTNQVIR